MVIETSLKQIHPGSDTALLFIHGILGNPMHFDFLFSEAKDCSIYSLLLDGHGKDAKALGKTDMQKWKEQVEHTLRELLKHYKNVYIIAHSMGTLFAMEAAIFHPVRIKGLFLMNTPLTIRLKPELFSTCIRVFFGCTKTAPPHVQGAKKCYGIGRDFKIWRYLFWIPRYLELFMEIHRMKGRMYRVGVPVFAFHSDLDEMIGRTSLSYFKRVRGAEMFHLPHSTHFYYTPKDKQILKKAFRSFLDPEKTGKADEIRKNL